MDEIKIGEHEVISSGSFITSEKDISKISFKRGNEKITLKIIFKEKEDKKIDISGNGIKQDFTISVEFPLIKNSLGEGPTNPINFAKFDNGDLLYLNIWIRKINEPNVEIIYSIYVEKISK